jgi:hypothetical protein
LWSDNDHGPYSSTVTHATDIGDLVDLPDSKVDGPILLDDFTLPSTSLKSIVSKHAAAFAAGVLEAVPLIFPCNIQYMDLTTVLCVLPICWRCWQHVDVDNIKQPQTTQHPISVLTRPDLAWYEAKVLNSM